VGGNAPLRASFPQHRPASAKFCALFRLNGEPPHKMRFAAPASGDLALPPVAQRVFLTPITEFFMNTQLQFIPLSSSKLADKHKILVAYHDSSDVLLDPLCDDPKTLSLAKKILKKAQSDLKEKAIVKTLITEVEGESEKTLSIIILPHTASRNLSDANFMTLQKAIAPLLDEDECSAYIAARRAEDHLGFALLLAKLSSKYTQKSDDDAKIQRLSCIFVGEHEPTAKKLEICNATALAVQNCAKWVDMPPNQLGPTSFADIIRHSASEVGIDCEIISGTELAERGFGGIYNVGKSAAMPPQLCILRYRAKEAKEHVAIVGKGVTFDTGGLCLKPREHITTMKGDMAGAAISLEIACLAARLKLDVNLTAVIGIAENAIGHEAYRPDDIITLYSGKTVEINNTDAEGRLLLADGVAYAAKHLNADVIIDIATLTGAQLIATGKQHAGVLTPSEALEKRIRAAGLKVGEPVFPLLYAREILMTEFKSEVADMKNSGKDRMNAQSSAAGHFVESHLGDFAGEWMHIDIAGPAWSEERATGYGVGLLLAFLKTKE